MKQSTSQTAKILILGVLALVWVTAASIGGLWSRLHQNIRHDYIEQRINNSATQTYNSFNELQVSLKALSEELAVLQRKTEIEEGVVYVLNITADSYFRPNTTRKTYDGIDSIAIKDLATGAETELAVRGSQPLPNVKQLGWITLSAAQELLPNFEVAGRTDAQRFIEVRITPLEPRDGP